LVQFPIERHEHQCIVGLGRMIHATRYFEEPCPLLVGSTLGTNSAEQPFKFTADFEGEQLGARIEITHENALTWQDRD
jgi:hypothetical protein